MNSRIYSEKMIENMRLHLDENASKFITYPKFVFLCGKAFSGCQYDATNRGITHKHLCDQSNDVFIVLSEKLWEDSFDSNIDLLTFEEFLAEISDSIILFVESPGSYCELGAFAYAEKLFSDKLIIVIVEQHKDSKSFIITGPTAKADKDGAKVIYAPLDGDDLLSNLELRSVLDDILLNFKSRSAARNRRNPNTENDKVLVNSFILELLELIKILQPISKKDLIDIYKRVKGFSSFTFIKKDGQKFHNEIKLDYIFKLLQTVELIDIQDNMVSCKQNRAQSLMFTYTKMAENRERSRMLCRKFRYRGSVL